MSARPNSTARRPLFAAGAIVALIIAAGYLILFREPVSATQPPPPTSYTLTINRAGDSGTVVVEPPTPSVTVSSFSWSHEYLPGTDVEVYPNCVGNWAFKEWTGPVFQHFSRTFVHMNANRTVTAVFVQASVSIGNVDICADQIPVTLGGAGLSGNLRLELVAQDSTATIYNATRAAGTYTLSFGWSSVPVGIEYTSLRATWSPCNSVVASCNVHFKNLGYYRQTQYNIPDENDATCASSGANVCFTNSQCAYSSGTLFSTFASQVQLNGSGRSINHGAVNVEAWCQAQRDQNGNLLYPPPSSCTGHSIFRENGTLIAASCGGNLDNTTVARRRDHPDLACNDTVCIIGIGTKTVTDEGGGLATNQLDNFVASGACTGITDLVPYPPGAITIKIY